MKRKKKYAFPRNTILTATVHAPKAGNYTCTGNTNSGEFKILDKLEYAYHKRIMNYDEKLDKVINFGLDELINLYKRKASMFNSSLNNEYCNLYFQLNKQNSNIN